ncbi:response regulator [Verrucomicrobiota bacterium sgz303538]
MVINDLILQVISLTQPRWKDQALAAGIHIDIRTELGSIPDIPADEADLKEALSILLTNSVDSIRKYGTITIQSEVQGRWVVVTVEDDGVGMTEEVRVRCMDPFATAKAEAGACDLSSVHRVVRRHDGGLDIQSEPGRGTAVSICLPIDSHEEAPEAPIHSVPVGKPLRVLVVEDEPLVREVLSVYLSEDRHQITVAANGRDGLEKFKQGTFDLVLTDRAMPEMNGNELAVQIKKLKPDQPVILLTGYGELMNGPGKQPEGVDLVVSKPFTVNGLRTAISSVMGE